jgi:DNA-binding winged helix-turn-helix (wHTH) protein
VQTTDFGTALTYRFGPYILDAARRVLLIGAETRPVSEKVFQLLLFLLGARGDVVTHESILAQVWPGEGHSEANVAQHVFMLRALLGEHARGRVYVVTVPGRGYRFAAPVEAKCGLTMKGSCDTCAGALPADADALICSYECTFCPRCAAAAAGRCTNCGGALERRPKRQWVTAGPPSL